MTCGTGTLLGSGTGGPNLAQAGLTVRSPSISLPSPRRWTVAHQPRGSGEIRARYADPLYRFLYSRLGNREDAEDLTVDVFIEASRVLDIEQTEPGTAASLFGVARAVLANHWRRYYGGGAPLDDARIAEAPETFTESERSRERTRQVSKLLGRLPDQYRRVLELRFLSGCSIGETALAMGLSEGRVKALQHRALARAAQLGDGLG
jgi:RNA polymerase sigma-70 factor (ECF subfamily)